jgi:hypothetical protein
LETWLAIEPLSKESNEDDGVLVFMYTHYTLAPTGKLSTQQRHNTESSKQMFPDKELRGLSPNFHILMFVSDLCKYSHDRSAYSASENTYISLTDT